MTWGSHSHRRPHTAPAPTHGDNSAFVDIKRAITPLPAQAHHSTQAQGPAVGQNAVVSGNKSIATMRSDCRGRVSATAGGIAASRPARLQLACLAILLAGMQLAQAQEPNPMYR